MSGNVDCTYFSLPFSPVSGACPRVVTLKHLYLYLPLYNLPYTYTMAAATVATPIPPPFFSPYLDDQSGKIQAKGVPWEVCSSHIWLDAGLTSKGYQRAKLLSADELTLLKSLNKVVSPILGTQRHTDDSHNRNVHPYSLLKDLNMLNYISTCSENYNGSIPSKPSW